MLLSPPATSPISTTSIDAPSPALKSGTAAQLEVTLPNGDTALTLATRRGDIATVRALLRGGAQREARALEIAVERREHELIAALTSP